MKTHPTLVLLAASLGWLVGCARVNPEFGTEQEGSSGPNTSQGNGSGSTSSSATPPATRTSGGSATSSATTNSADSTTSPPDDSGPEESSGPGPACPNYPDNSISIELFDMNDALIEVSPGCDGSFDPKAFGAISANSGVIHWNFGGCDGPLGPGYNIVLSDNVVIPAGLPGCGRFVAWEGYRNGVCEWIGMAVFNDEDPEPEFIVTNSLDLINDVPFVEVGLQEMDVCLDQCPGFPPGQYGLVFSPNPPLAEGDVQSMDLEFVDGVTTYWITNHMSWVDVACDEHVAWDAALQ